MKCAWKKELMDGSPEKYYKVGLKFYPCDGFNGVTHRNKPILKDELYKYYCENCGANIRKPEPEPEKPLIVKSGGTVVINWNDKNYLCVWPHVEWSLKDYSLHFEPNMHDKTRYKPFSEIILTDEIAKLRPMIMLKDSPSIPVKLWGIEKSMGIFSSKNNWLIDGYRFATPKELQEETLANKQ